MPIKLNSELDQYGRLLDKPATSDDNLMDPPGLVDFTPEFLERIDRLEGGLDHLKHLWDTMDATIEELREELRNKK